MPQPPARLLLTHGPRPRDAARMSREQGGRAEHYTLGFPRRLLSPGEGIYPARSGRFGEKGGGGDGPS
jgi:hypothetical protein